jgi:predicted nuclease of restriction endonuclease-like (RecB) superfamily
MNTSKRDVPKRKRGLIGPSKKAIPSEQESMAVIDETKLIADLRGLIRAARHRVATVANATTTLLYWHVGQRLSKDILRGKRAAFGERILVTVSQQLCAEFGNGYSYSALTRMVRFAEFFPEQAIVVTLSQQLSWSHVLAILPIKDPLAREFYAEMCRIECWDVRTLRKKIGSMLFQRTALSKNTKEVISQEIGNLRDGRMTPELVFRDPYFLDFLGLKGMFSEHDLESAILREMESFLLEMGSGFSFVARQKRISVGKDDFHLDLLFFHRHLRRLVAIELKLESFEPAHVGQMELYLRWLDKNEKAPGEEPPIGLILCAAADVEQVELFELDKRSIRVSEYLTELPPRKMLESRLHEAIAHAREMAARRERMGEERR